MVSTILPSDLPSPILGWSQKVKIQPSEHGHVAYQIIWNYKCSNMVANSLPADRPLLLDLGVENSTFKNIKKWNPEYMQPGTK